MCIRDSNKLTPDIPIISEETFELSSLKNLNETYWLVDPLDGTKEFINKTDEFTVNIALINNKSSVFGIVAAPVTGKIWHGSMFDKETETNEISDNFTKYIVMSKSHKNQNDENFLEFLDINKVSYKIVEDDLIRIPPLNIATASKNVPSSSFIEVLQKNKVNIERNDIFVVTQKIVSKSEGDIFL